MNIYLMELITFIVTFILGYLAKKKSWISNNIIPIQNLFIGLISTLIYYFIYKDFSFALTISGITAGGAYDILHNLKKIDWESFFMRSDL